MPRCKYGDQKSYPKALDLVNCEGVEGSGSPEGGPGPNGPVRVLCFPFSCEAVLLSTQHTEACERSPAHRDAASG